MELKVFAVFLSFGCIFAAEQAVNVRHTDWSNWTRCNETCGKGYQQRERMVKEIKTCQSTECPVNGGYTDWSDWTRCNETCGKGYQQRQRTCTNPPPSHNGTDCSSLGESTEIKKCQLSECPVNGGYTDWSNWTRCNETCGEGYQQRQRTCTNPPPSHNGTDCSSLGESTEIKKCQLRECPINGGYTDWSNWTRCNETCGKGYQQRQRTCTNPPPSHNGTDCSSLGESTEIKKCQLRECRVLGNPVPTPVAVNGGYTDWSNWTQCNETCGKGYQQRQRTCTNPPPSHNGTDCSSLGESTEIRTCQLTECQDQLVRFGNAKYHFSNTKMTWSNGKENCVRMGGYLASIHSQDEQNFLVKEIKDRKIGTPWLGGNDIKREGSWVWSDLTKMNFKTWYWREPNNLGNEDCLSTIGTDTKWNDAPCHLKRHFICKILFYNGHKYFISSDKKDFASAEQFCVNLGGHLASVHSKDENDFLFEEWKKRSLTYTWIGFNDRIKEGQWEWTDGSKVNFKKWSQKEPNNLYNEDCTHTGFHNKNEWNDNQCKNKYNYICKF